MLLRTFPDREQIVAWLSDNLDDSDPRRRAGAAWGLGELRDSFGLMQLRKYANQEYNASVRDVILEAINTIISNEDMTPAPPVHTTIIAAEDAVTDEYVHPEPVAAAVSPADLLLDQLLTFDSQQQAKAAALLAELPVTTYLPRVQALLTKPTAVNDRARFSLVRLLGHSGHPDALSTLLTVLRYDPEVRVKEAALEEITKYETHSAASIVALVTDPDLSLESLELVVRALGQSREPTIQDALVQLLKDERELPNKSRIRDVAYLALQHSEQPHIRHALDQYLLEHQRTQPVELVSPGDFPADAGDTPALKMARLVETLQGRRKTHELVAAARALTGYARELSKGSDESVLPVLAAAMQDPNYFVRWAVIEAIGFLRPDDALPQLNEALHDTHYTVRLAAINAMLEIGDKQSDVALLARMEDQHHEVRVKAAEALGELGTADTADRMLAYSRHPDFLTRSAVIASLGRLRNPRTLPAIADALKDDDMLVVSTAIKALGLMKHPDGVPHLVSMLADARQSSWESKTLGELAIDALHSIGTADALAEIHRFRGRLARR
jgi:HEAT repeat protein